MMRKRKPKVRGFFTEEAMRKYLKSRARPAVDVKESVVKSIQADRAMMNKPKIPADLIRGAANKAIDSMQGEEITFGTLQKRAEKELPLLLFEHKKQQRK